MDLLKAIRSIKRPDPDARIEGHLTPWGEALDPAHVLERYPHPQFMRQSFISLNGFWEYAFAEVEDDAGAQESPSHGQHGHDRGQGHGRDNDRPMSDLPQPAFDLQTAPSAMDGRILVPFSPESLLSGVGRQLKPEERLWYRRRFETPVIPQGFRCILHFEAVDHACSCFVNGRLCGSHEGGYLPFSFDISDLLRASEEPGPQNELVVCVVDPSELGQQPRGKQLLSRGGIFYTATSGIWQTVWMEVVPALRLLQASIQADPATGRITIDVTTTGDAPADEAASDVCVRATVEAPATGKTLGTGEMPGMGEMLGTGETIDSEDGEGGHVELVVPHPELWSPDDPCLYPITVTLGSDVVRSYCAFRSFSLEDVGGMKRFCVNGKPLFLEGILDQGYWSDGLLTAPSDEALISDIELARDFGFNMIRMHAKVEADRWYYHCDRLGMIVWQDMVNGGGAYSAWWTNFRPTLFHFTWNRFSDRHHRLLACSDPTARAKWLPHALATVDYLSNHPCICTWVAFNEGWGQHDTEEVITAMREADPTRSIDEASGWYDQGGGDFKSIHNYFRRYQVEHDRHRRAVVISEFGGFAYYVAGHSALDHAYGYEMYKTLPGFQDAVDKARAEVRALGEKGLCGSVYTQLSDVEEEDNGLQSFDRRVVKGRRADER